MKAVLRIRTLILIEVILLSSLTLVIAATAAIILPLLLIEPWTVAAGFAALTLLGTILVIVGYNGLVTTFGRKKKAVTRLVLATYLVVGLSGLYNLLTRQDYSASLDALGGLIGAAVGIYLLVMVFVNNVIALRIRRQWNALWTELLVFHVANLVHLANEHADHWDTRKTKTTAGENLNEIGDLITRHLARTVRGNLPGGRPAAEKFARSAAAAVIELKAQLMRADGRTVVLVKAKQYLSSVLREAWLELPTSELAAPVRRKSLTETVRMLLGAAAAVILVWVLQRFGVVPSEYSGWVWGVVLMYAVFTIISAIDPRIDERLQAFLKIGSSLRALRDNKADEE